MLGATVFRPSVRPSPPGVQTDTAHLPMVSPLSKGLGQLEIQPGVNSK